MAAFSAQDENTFFAKYELGKKLGSGATSVVTQATRNTDGAPVAIKCIRKRKLSQPDTENLLHAVEILREIQHPHILRLIDFFEGEQAFYLVTDFVEGGDLFERIQSKVSYSEQEARVLVTILLQTLDHIHKNGVMHLDLKPENFLLAKNDDDTDIKLADFSFAKRNNELVDEGFCGTPDYMPPEILNGGKLSSAVDIWGAGVITFILLGGYPPFFADDDASIINLVQNSPVEFHSPFWDNVSQQAKDMISLMMQKDAAKRPTAKDLLQHPWLKATGGNDLTGAIAELRKWMARRKLRTGVRSIIAMNRMSQLKNITKLAAEGGDRPLTPEKPKAEESVLDGIAVTDKAFTDDYLLGKRLGAGAFSIVRRAVHKTTEKEYAVKCIRKKGLKGKEQAALESEIKILTTLRHPNILRLEAVYNEPTHYYLLTELVKGGELFDRICAKTVYSEQDAKGLAHVLLSSVAHLHSNGVIHRDLKPENLLLASADDDIDIKICDFGFAKELAELEGEKSIMGTPDYIAPEILTAQQYGPPVDIWSSGVIIYILLGGYPPFYHEDESALFNIIKTGVFEFHSPFWDAISPAAKSLIESMLTVNPKKRLTAQQCLDHPWFAEESSSKNLDASLSKLKTWNARRKFKGGVAAVIALNRMAGAFKVKAKGENVPAAADAQQQTESEKSPPPSSS